MTAAQPHDRAAAAAGLIRLSQPVEPKDLPDLATFDAPASLTSQTLKVDRLAKLCPSTGRPDQFRVEVTYPPSGGRCLELDSLVLYLEAYHSVAVSGERLADQLAAAVLAQTLAVWVEVTLHQVGREGAELKVTVRHNQSDADKPASR